MTIRDLIIKHLAAGIEETSQDEAIRHSIITLEQMQELLQWAKDAGQQEIVEKLQELDRKIAALA